MPPLAMPPKPTDPAAHDPMPEPPPPLDLDACCGQDCDPCVLELQAAALDRHRAELAAWQARQGRPLSPINPPPTPP